MSNPTHLEQIVGKYAESVSQLETHVIEQARAMQALVEILVQKGILDASIIEFEEEAEAE